MPEIAILVDYTVVRTYVALISQPEFKENPDVFLITAQFFKRMVFQLKQVWIFYQLDFLVAFQEFLSEGQCNNSLMRGFSEIKSQVVNRRLENAKALLKEVLTTIVTYFIELQRVNPMAAVEALFRYQSKDIKDQILSNYSDGLRLDNGKALDERIIYADEEVV